MPASGHIKKTSSSTPSDPTLAINPFIPDWKWNLLKRKKEKRENAESPSSQIPQWKVEVLRRRQEQRSGQSSKNNSLDRTQREISSSLERRQLDNNSGDVIVFNKLLRKDRYMHSSVPNLSEFNSYIDIYNDTEHSEDNNKAERLIPIISNPILRSDLEKRKARLSSENDIEDGEMIVKLSEEMKNEDRPAGEVEYGRGFVGKLLKKFSSMLNVDKDSKFKIRTNHHGNNINNNICNVNDNANKNRPIIKSNTNNNKNNNGVLNKNKMKQKDRTINDEELFNVSHDSTADNKPKNANQNNSNSSARNGLNKATDKYLRSNSVDDLFPENQDLNVFSLNDNNNFYANSNNSNTQLKKSSQSLLNVSERGRKQEDRIPFSTSQRLSFSDIDELPKENQVKLTKSVFENNFTSSSPNLTLSFGNRLNSIDDETEKMKSLLSRNSKYYGAKNSNSELKKSTKPFENIKNNDENKYDAYDNSKCNGRNHVVINNKDINLPDILVSTSQQQQQQNNATNGHMKSANKNNNETNNKNPQQQNVNINDSRVSKLVSSSKQQHQQTTNNSTTSTSNTIKNKPGNLLIRSSSNLTSSPVITPYNNITKDNKTIQNTKRPMRNNQDKHGFSSQINGKMSDDKADDEDKDDVPVTNIDSVMMDDIVDINLNIINDNNNNNRHHSHNHQSRSPVLSSLTSSSPSSSSPSPSSLSTKSRQHSPPPSDFKKSHSNGSSAFNFEGIYDDVKEGEPVEIPTNTFAFTFEGEGVIVGKSAMVKNTRTFKRKKTVTFPGSDTTLQIFEYPPDPYDYDEFTDNDDDDDDDEIRDKGSLIIMKNKNVLKPPSMNSSNLASYRSRSQVDFEFGSTDQNDFISLGQPMNDDYNVKTDSHDLMNGELDYLVPAAPNPWSSSVTADILF